MADRGVHKDALRNWDKAVIPPEKLGDYSLEMGHLEGGSDKARVFKSVLGFETQYWEVLSDIIRARLPEYPAFKRGATAYGDEWTVHIPVVGPTGNLAIVTTGWIFLKEDPTTPRLTTCLIQTKKQKKLKKLLGLEP